jgi:AcrR family transcriptional regulator
VGRWEPDARGRLERAALDLYSERGYDQTTVADIAERAGLTERTFFRHFTDKREVLFRGNDLAHAVIEALAAAPESASPLDVVALALESVSDFFADRRPYARLRRSVIAAHPSLQERELIKLASLAESISDALRGRGVAEPAATLAAEAGVTVFKVAFERWLDDPRKRDLAVHLRETLADLKAVAT